MTDDSADPFEPAPADTGAGETDEAPSEPLPPDSLGAKVIDSVNGFTPVPGANADRYLDLDAAAAMQPDPTEELPLLETRGFQGGWTRVFRNDTQDVVVATVYQFEDSAEAAFYLEDGLITITGYGGQLFEIEEFPEARGFRQDSADAIGPLVSYGISFTDGPLWYLVFLTGDPQTATLDIVVAATLEQAQLAGTR